ncbi:RTA1 like protein-domain-containing protein [Pyronema omphalodes]|nr:RTA1 like protein-domain-containing protein [Pyronema omphalodes]
MGITNIDFVYYRYTPTLIGAVIFSACFFIVSFIHAWKIIRTKTWYFIPMLIGSLMEALGYIGRAQSHFKPHSLGPYLLQSLLLLIAPALFAASIYMILGRLILVLSASHHSPIPIRWLTKLFVLGDVISFLMQSAGGGIMAGGTLESMKRGEKIVIGGLFVQVLFFAVFVVVAIVFNIRINWEPTVESSSVQRRGRNGWGTLLKTLYWASGAILVRSVFRVVEYVQGNGGYLMRNEVWLYVFDAVLMLGVIAVFCWVHPSAAVPGDVKKKTKRGGYNDVEMRSN